MSPRDDHPVRDEPRARDEPPAHGNPPANGNQPFADELAPRRLQRPARLSLRVVDAGATARDVVGELVRADEHQLVVLPAGRGPVVVERRDVRAMRRVPARVVRPTSPVEDLWDLVAFPAGQGHRVRMGGWSLRDHCCRAVGDPGREPARAVEAVADFYRARGVVPRIQVAARGWQGDGPGARLDARLGGAGWQVEDETVLWTLDLRQASVRAAGATPRLMVDDWALIDPLDGAAPATAVVAGAVEAGARFGWLELPLGVEPPGGLDVVEHHHRRTRALLS